MCLSRTLIKGWLSLDQERVNSVVEFSQQSILAIIVLYKTSLENCISYTSLQRAALEVPAEALKLCVLLYDNTPDARAPESLPANVIYMAGVENRGLASAYNFALTMAVERGFEWLLTLDQDTRLPADALSIYVTKAAALASRLSVAAVVPQIIADGRVVSPNYFAAGAWPRWFAPGFSGVPQRKVYAFNSGSLIRVTALRQAHGYSPWFWLDNSDSAMFRQLSKFGKEVYVAGDLSLDHDFSMMNMQERVSAERYRTILLSESAFWDLEMNRLAGLERTARLAGRVFKHWLRGDPKPLRRLTWAGLRARLFQSRRTRVEIWREATRERLGGVVEGWSATTRPRVSVCMAAYNGERFIEAQLRSILPQLCAEDEVVIVDDRSQDNTVQRVRALQAELAGRASAPHIRLIKHETNRGVIRTFEDAIRSATGDILFLCDDDDLWAPKKVEKVLEMFLAEPKIELVCTGLRLMDQDGEPLNDASYLRHRRFSANITANLLHNQFQGSTMAFRSSLVEHVLPFPMGRLFLHDAWIGLSNTLAGGRTAYLDEPLLLYRRHSGNYSRQMSRLKQVRLRLELIAALAKKHVGRMLSS